MPSNLKTVCLKNFNEYKKLKFKNLLKKNFYSIILFHGVIKKIIQK